jgi:ABC-2 type transport system ATP-binding protein
VPFPPSSAGAGPAPNGPAHGTPALEEAITTAPTSRPPEGCVAEFQHIRKTWTGPWPWSKGGVQALQDVSFRVESGEIFGLLGPNRAGKTTLIKILLSLCRATSGTVFRLGQPVGDRSTLARVGYVHENHAFPRYLNARELLQYYGALSLIHPDVLSERVPQLLERVGLADRSREPIARFSKGMVQRLGLAQALINEPRLLVLDEPTEGLDLAGRQLLRAVMGEIKQQGGSVLLVSHALPEVEQVCDRIGVIVAGQLVHLGPVPREGASLERTLQDLYYRADM